MPETPLGHSITSHFLLGWCSHCPGHSALQEMSAWRVWAGRLPHVAAEIERQQTGKVRQGVFVHVYVSIGNSDDKLSQREWSAFHADVRCELIGAGARFHGQWVSPSTSEWQNACWLAELNEAIVEELKTNLGRLARKYRQDSIAWARVPETEFLPGAG